MYTTLSTSALAYEGKSLVAGKGPKVERVGGGRHVRTLVCSWQGISRETSEKPREHQGAEGGIWFGILQGGEGGLRRCLSQLGLP